jgi:hypothetical protein
MNNSQNNHESQAPIVPEGPKQLEFTPVGGVRLQAVFDEPELSSDGGVLLVREAAEVNGIIDAMAAVIRDERSQVYVKHTLHEILTQRVVQICHGYEDANDCDKLRDDVAFKAAAGHAPSDPSLASQPTVSRLENSVGLRDLLRLFYVFVDNFIDSYESAPECIVIDIDPTANRVYGDQQLALFNAHYDEYCLMPFHVYEGLTGRLIATVVRPGKTPTKEEIIALLKRIVRRIRARFSNTTIVVRGDSHHTKPAVLDWLEANDVRYVLGMAVNAVLCREAQEARDYVRRVQREDWRPCRRFHSFGYAAGSWSRPRRIVARVEATANGTDTRFIVTDMERVGAKFLYEKVYCDRGNAELMIKEHKCFLKSSRTSCNTAEANQFRLYLHSAAYVVMHGLRSTLLKGTEMASATFDTIRLRLLKVAARVQVAKTFVRFHMPISCPVACLFTRAAAIVSGVRTT